MIPPTPALSLCSLTVCAARRWESGQLRERHGGVVQAARFHAADHQALDPQRPAAARDAGSAAGAGAGARGRAQRAHPAGADAVAAARRAQAQRRQRADPRRRRRRRPRGSRPRGPPPSRPRCAALPSAALRLLPQGCERALRCGAGGVPGDGGGPAPARRAPGPAHDQRHAPQIPRYAATNLSTNLLAGAN